jgi:hypothetical protein
MPEDTSASDLFNAKSKQWQALKMGRPFNRTEMPLPESDESRLDFTSCFFDFCRGRMAFMEHRGDLLRSLHIIFLSTMHSMVIHTFPVGPREIIRGMKMSERLVVMLSAFG